MILRRILKPLHQFHSKRFKINNQKIIHKLSCFFSESTPTPPQQQQVYPQFDRMVAYYRTILEDVLVKQNDQAIFSQAWFQTIISYSQKKKQQKLLFEIFYNFVGHNTQMKSKTIDKMILKVIGNSPQFDQQKLLQIYNNHIYIRYYPHYSTTNKLIQSVNQENYSKLINICLNSPFIKFNQNIVQLLLKKLDSQISHTNYSLTIKLLLQRSSLKILPIQQQKVAKFIVQSLQKKNTQGNLKLLQRSNYFQDFTNLFQDKQCSQQVRYGLAVINYVGGNYRKFVQLIITLQQKTSIEKCVQFLALGSQKYRENVYSQLQKVKQNMSQLLSISIYSSKSQTQQPAQQSPQKQ